MRHGAAAQRAIAVPALEHADLPAQSETNKVRRTSEKRSRRTYQSTLGIPPGELGGVARKPVVESDGDFAAVPRHVWVFVLARVEAATSQVSYACLPEIQKPT